MSPPPAETDSGSRPAVVRATSLVLAEAVPAEVPVGSQLSLKLRVICEQAGDLGGGLIEIADPDSAVTVHRIVGNRDGGLPSVFAIAAPERLGSFTWNVKFPRQEIGGIVYEESALDISLTTQRCGTSLAVWNVPSPVMIGRSFRIAVGARSSGGVSLAGADIAVIGESDAIVGRGILGDAPWPGTSALYWCEITLPAPMQEGVHQLRAAFAASDVALAHTGASTRFSFAAARPPDHILTVRVAADGVPVAGVQVALGPYRGETDGSGIAGIEAPTGNFDLAVWHPDYEAFSERVAVAQDCTVAVTLVPLPEQMTAWG